MRKKCKICNEEKLLDDFHFRASTKDNRNSYCKLCACSETRKWYSKNKNRAKLTAKLRYSKDKSKNWNLRRYGITLSEYNTLLEKQDGKCMVCNELPKLRSLSVDHNHKTGKIRGLLCGSCNTALGLLKEDLTLIENLKNYLILWEEENA